MIPLILGAIALGTAAFGAVKGAEGFGKRIAKYCGCFLKRNTMFLQI